VAQYGQQAKTPLEVASELRPKWSGLLGVDGKELPIRGQELTVLIAQDVGTFDPVLFGLAESENRQEAKRFFLTIKEVLHYPTKGIVSDLGRGKTYRTGLSRHFSSGLCGALLPIRQAYHSGRKKEPLVSPKSSLTKHHQITGATLPAAQRALSPSDPGQK